MAKSRRRANKPQRQKKPRWKSKPATIAPPPPAQLPRPESNTRLELTMVPGFPPDHPQSKVPRPRQGSPGVYKITFVLSVPGKGAYRDELDIPTLMRAGDSLLVVSPGTHLKAYLWNDTERVEILFESNRRGSLSIAQLRLSAKSFEDAERTAYDLVMPQLSYWSYLFNVAIDAVGYEIHEEQTENRKYVFGVIGKLKALELGEKVFTSKPEYRRVFAAYREGMNATNVFYQVLSFYKVAEGIRSLRAQRRAQAVAKGEKPADPSERIPEKIEDVDAEFLDRAALDPFLGKKFSFVLDQYRGLIRNAVAHLDPSQTVLDVDRYDDVVTCLKAVPVLKYVARHMIDNDLQAQEALPADSK